MPYEAIIATGVLLSGTAVLEVVLIGFPFKAAVDCCRVLAGYCSCITGSGDQFAGYYPGRPEVCQIPDLPVYNIQTNYVKMISTLLVMQTRGLYTAVA